MKISENLCFMYGQNFKNILKNFQIGAGIHWKNQNLFGLPIWPPKMPNLFELANQASKNAKFVWIGSKITIFARLSVSTQTNYVIIHSPSIPSETGYFLPTPIHSLTFHSWWRGLSGVSMMMGFWGVIGLSKYPVCKTINKWEILKIHPAMEGTPVMKIFWECLHHLTYRIKKICTNDLESSRKSDIHIQSKACKLHSY